MALFSLTTTARASITHFRFLAVAALLCVACTGSSRSLALQIGVPEVLDGTNADTVVEAPVGVEKDTAKDGVPTPVSNWTLAPAPDAGANPATADMVSAEASTGTEDLGAMAFAKSCAGCHAIGGDANLSGPNLAPTATWAVADLELAVKRMEKFAGPMSQEQVHELVNLLQDSEAAARVKEQQDSKAKKMTASMEKPSAQLGEQLFHGDATLANGGIACSACHTAGSAGGSMGPDLEKAFSRMGQMALQSACEQGNFKVMSAAYRDHKVTAQEALHLTEYLKRVDEVGAPASANPSVPLFGSAGAVGLLAGLGFLYRKQNGGPVRRKLVRRR